MENSVKNSPDKNFPQSFKRLICESIDRDQISPTFLHTAWHLLGVRGQIVAQILRIGGNLILANVVAFQAPGILSQPAGIPTTMILSCQRKRVRVWIMWGQGRVCVCVCIYYLSIYLSIPIAYRVLAVWPTL